MMKIALVSRGPWENISSYAKLCTLGEFLRENADRFEDLSARVPETSSAVILCLHGSDDENGKSDQTVLLCWGDAPVAILDNWHGGTGRTLVVDGVKIFTDFVEDSDGL